MISIPARVLLFVVLGGAGLSCNLGTEPRAALRTAWLERGPGSGRAKPAIVGENVIFPTTTGQLLARSRRTGALVWQTDVSVAPVDGRNIIVVGSTAIVATHHETVAVDAGTGSIRWRYRAPLDTVDEPRPYIGQVADAFLDAD
ncbi:MAG: PQQ-binding-like beta-propeller repeat protein [Gemmatimonadaceae bacterium]